MTHRSVLHATPRTDGGRASRARLASMPAWGWAVLVAVLVAVVVLASRLPLLGHGYGGDPDAWRAMWAAQRFLETGVYRPSRVPGFPLPEFVDAVMLQVGLGSSLAVGMVSAVLSAVAAALFGCLLLPLGRGRATAGALALAFTPVVYVASLGAMDYVWGLTFFLAATLCVTARRIGWAAVLLGLAVASRPTYALAFLPLALLLVDVEPARLLQARVWRRLATLAVGSGVVALAFFVPAFLTVGFVRPTVYGTWVDLFANVSIQLFGIAGCLGVVGAVVSAWSNARRGVPVERSRAMDGWAITVILMFGAAFAYLPDEASYLIPALTGLYWLLCRYAGRWMPAVLAASLLLSCFVGGVRHHGEGVRVAPAGPVIHDLEVQAEHRCVAAVVARALREHPGSYAVVGSLRPQLLWEVGRPLSDRLVETVRPGPDGQLVDPEATGVPAAARLLLLDRAAEQQAQAWPPPAERVIPLDSSGQCTEAG